MRYNPRGPIPHGRVDTSEAPPHCPGRAEVIAGLRLHVDGGTAGLSSEAMEANLFWHQDQRISLTFCGVIRGANPRRPTSVVREGYNRSM